MKIVLIQVILPLVTYFIGVYIGRRSLFMPPMWKIIKMYQEEEDGQDV